MKKPSVLFYIILIMLFACDVFAADYLKALPQDLNAKPAASGSATKVFYNDTNADGTPDNTTGSWQEVFLPAGNECKAVVLQVHGGTDTEYDLDTAAVGFLYSHETGGAFAYVGPQGVAISIGKIAKSTAVSLGWVKAATGNKIAILTLY